MLAKAAVTVAPKSYYFCPEDLARLRHAFNAACLDRPFAARTELQRLALSKAVVVTYRPGISEKDLVAAALHLVSGD
ncbi:MAG TPA: hypothetical protein VM144_10500 [Aestuariivirga sp.]|nr:hypothetical protein [Aestuariivirga sp.]